MEIVTQSDTYNKVQQNKAKSSNFGCFGCFSILLLIIMMMIMFALSMFSNYNCKVKQHEPKRMLFTIYTMQEAYMSKHGSYADNGTLGFTVNGKYSYNIILNSPTSYKATAVSDNDGKGIRGEAGDDVWTINEKPELRNAKNACH